MHDPQLQETAAKVAKMLAFYCVRNSSCMPILLRCGTRRRAPEAEFISIIYTTEINQAVSIDGVR